MTVQELHKALQGRVGGAVVVEARTVERAWPFGSGEHVVSVRVEARRQDGRSACLEVAPQLLERVDAEKVVEVVAREMKAELDAAEAGAA